MLYDVAVSLVTGDTLKPTQSSLFAAKLTGPSPHPSAQTNHYKHRLILKLCEAVHNTGSDLANLVFELVYPES